MAKVRQYRIALEKGYWRYEITFTDGEILAGPPATALGYPRAEDAFTAAEAQAKVLAMRERYQGGRTRGDSQRGGAHGS